MTESQKRYTRVSPEEQKELARLYETGLSLRAIAAQTRRAYATVHKAVAAQGVMRDRSGKKKGA